MSGRPTALVTGSSVGIGKELARLFANDGHDVVLVARRREKLEAVAQEIEKDFDVKAHVITSDLTEADAPKVLFAELQSKGLEVDVLVNNAGFGSNGAFAGLPLDRELAMIQLNINSLVALTHLALGSMIARGKGRVLNIASTAGFQPGPYMSVYYATKSFVILFTEGIATELQGTGVTATAHCPGATATEFAGIAGNDETPLFKLAVADAQSVARHAFRSTMNGSVVAIPGLLNRIAAFSVRFTPRWLIRKITAWANGK